MARVPCYPFSCGASPCALVSLGGSGVHHGCLSLLAPRLEMIRLAAPASGRRAGPLGSLRLASTCHCLETTARR